jgi:hypothetical protein
MLQNALRSAWILASLTVTLLWLAGTSWWSGRPNPHGLESFAIVAITIALGWHLVMRRRLRRRAACVPAR